MKKSILQSPSLDSRAEFLAAVTRSRKLHGRWAVPPRTAKAFDTYLARFSAPSHVGFWILAESGELAGVINISEIVRGNFQSGYLGYYAFAPHNSKGYMCAGLKEVVRYAFRNLKLHRLEANIQPGNERSRKLIQHLGFRLEGFSNRYLKIAGRWRDHQRWAITVEDWRELGRQNAKSVR